MNGWILITYALMHRIAYFYFFYCYYYFYATKVNTLILTLTLTYTVLDSGHMVPMDKPKLSLAMIDMFMREKSFVTGVSRIPAVHNSNSTSETCICPLQPTFSSNNSGSRRYSSKYNNIKNKKRHIKAVPLMGRQLIQIDRDDEANKDVENEAKLRASPHLVLPYHLIINAAIPLDTSAMIHLRLQHQHISPSSSSLSSSSSSHLQQQSLQHLHPHYHHQIHNKVMITHILENYRCELRIEPGNRTLPIPINIDLLEQNKWTLHVVVDELKGGHDYSFSVWMIDKYHHDRIINSSKRDIMIRIGCYHPTITQCCGRGICYPPQKNDGDVMLTSSSYNSRAKPSCKCDAGYSGDNCDYYEVRVYADVTMNVSAADTVCSAQHLMSFHATGDVARGMHQHHHHMINRDNILNSTTTTTATTSTNTTANKVAKVLNSVVNSESTITSITIANANQSYQYCQLQIHHQYCCLSIELMLLNMKSINNNSWLSSSRVASYKSYLTEILRHDIIADSLIHVEFKLLLEAIKPSADDRIVFNITQGHTNTPYSLLSPHPPPPVSTQHQHIHSQQHNSHHLSYSSYHPISMMICGDPKTVELIIEQIKQQRLDPTSRLRNGLVTAFMRPNHMIVVNHKSVHT